jgi:hypothetical protein
MFCEYHCQTVESTTTKLGWNYQKNYEIDDKSNNDDDDNNSYESDNNDPYYSSDSSETPTSRRVSS